VTNTGHNVFQRHQIQMTIYKKRVDLHKYSKINNFELLLNVFHKII